MWILLCIVRLFIFRRCYYLDNLFVIFYFLFCYCHWSIHTRAYIYVCITFGLLFALSLECFEILRLGQETRNWKGRFFFLVKEREKVENIMLLFSTLRKASIVFAPLNYTCTHRTSYFIWSFFFTTTSYFVWSLPACNFNHNFMQTPMSDLQGTGLVLEYHRVK